MPQVIRVQATDLLSALGQHKHKKPGLGSQWILSEQACWRSECIPRNLECHVVTDG